MRASLRYDVLELYVRVELEAVRNHGDDDVEVKSTPAAAKDAAGCTPQERFNCIRPRRAITERLRFVLEQVSIVNRHASCLRPENQH